MRIDHSLSYLSLRVIRDKSKESSEPDGMGSIMCRDRIPGLQEVAMRQEK